MLEINWNPSHRELRQFAGIWLPAFAVLVGMVLVYRGGSYRGPIVICSVAALIAGVGLASPRLVRPVFVGWTLAAYPIGWSVSHIVLGAIYYGLFTLVGLTMRVLRYDALQRRQNRPVSTHWIARREPVESSRYFRQF